MMSIAMINLMIVIIIIRKLWLLKLAFFDTKKTILFIVIILENGQC
jgi:hypothetical protein